MMKKLFFTIAVFFALFIYGNNVSAAVITSTAAGGTWSVGSTWVGGVAPATTDSAVIATTGGNSVNIGAATTNAGLTVNSGAILNFSGAFVLTENGNVVVNGSITGGTGTITMNSNGKTVDGSGTIGSIISAAKSFSFLSTANLIINNNINSAGVTVTNNGTIDLNGNYARTGGTAIWVQGTNAVTNITGAFTPAANVTLTATASGNIVNYNGASAQTAENTTYNIFKANNAAGVTLGGASTITTLTVGDATANSIFSDGGFAITPGTGSVLNLTGGTYQLGSAGTATTWPAWATVNITAGTTVNYASGAATQTVSTVPSYSNLLLSGLSKIIASGTLTVSGNLTVNSGATYLGSTNNPVLNLGGNFSNSGTFTQGTGLLTFNGTAAQTIGGSTATAFNNVTVSNTSVAITVNTNFSIANTRSLTINASAILSPAAAVIISGAGTLTGNGTVQVKRTAATADFSSQYTITNKTLTNLTVEYAGAAAQTVSALTYGGLKINNSNGVTLGGVATVGGTLTLTTGNITTGANNLYVNSTGSVSRTSGQIVGNLRKFIATGATNKTFEIGDASNYAPVSIAFGNVTVAGDLTISTTAGDHPSIGSSQIIPTLSVNRYWTLANSGITFTNYSATFNFINPGDLDAGADTSNFSVGEFASSAWSYPTVGTKTTVSTQATGITGFGDFQVGEKYISTVTALGTSVSPQVYGSTVTFTATVTPASGGAPSGTVTFMDGATTIDIATLNGANPGVTTYATTTLSVIGSPHSITAVYNGDTRHTGSTSSAVTQAITAKALTVSGITANNKVYDRFTTATLNVGSAALVGVISGDTVTLNTGSATGAFADKTVADGKTVIVSGLTISGADSANYSLTQPTATANITALGLTVTGITSNDKVYDQGTTATLNTASAALVGVISGDTVTLNTGSAVGSFATKTVGSGKTVTISGLTISGTDSGNYSLTQPTTTASITALALTVSGIAANNKVYDRTTTATLVGAPGSLVGVISGDTVTLGGTAAGAFADKTVATGKTVTISGLIISGADSANYSVTQPTTTADITAKDLTVTGITANNKVYDRFTTATLNTGSAALVGVISGDTVTLNTGSAVGSFADKLVANGKTVTVSGLTLSGTDSVNYSVTQPTTTANITAAALTVTGITANNKVYDQGTTVTLNTGSAALVGVISGDTVTLNTGSATGSFATKTVGLGKTVTISGLTISGTDSGNYSLTQPTTTASITAVTLTVTGITANNKIYDGTTTATLNTGSAVLNGVISGDTVTLNVASATGTFSDSNVGTGKTVTISGLTISGADAGNYLLTQPTTTADITPAPIVATKIVIIQPSNGTVDAPVSVTIQAQNNSGVLDTSYNNSVTLVAGGAATGGVVNIVNGVGTVSASDTVTETVVLSLTDTNHTGLDVSSTANVTFGPGAVKIFSLNNPGNMTAGNRLGYTVTRKDQYGNLVTAGASTVYLYSSSTGGNKKFYDSAVGGSIIVSLSIADGISSANFWYYDEAAGNYIITASDHSPAPDGSTGIADATQAVTVNTAAVYQFILTNPGTATAGYRTGFTVARQDQFGNAVSSGSTSVYLYSSSTGSAKTFYDAGTGGNATSTFTIGNNATSTAFWYYDELAGSWTITASDNSSAPDGTTGIHDASQVLVVSPGPTSQFFLNNPGNMTAGTRLGYTVSRSDSFGNTVSSGAVTVYLYSNSSGSNKAFYVVSSGGIPITSVSIPDGQTNANFWYYDELAGTWTVTASDNATAGDGAAGIVDATRQVVVSPAFTKKFLLNNPGNMVSGSRLEFTVSREDAFNNIVTSGFNQVYLFASSTNGSPLFYDAATNGNVVSSASINDTSSSANFWFYETAVGTATVTASDNAVAPDGAAGIVDASQSITVLSAPIVATRLVIQSVATSVAGTAATVTVQAEDNDNNIDTTFSGSVTLLSSGSASSTGSGIIHLTNGIGTVNLNDYVAETSHLTLSDTGGTGLNVSSAVDALFTAGPAAKLLLINASSITAGTRLQFTATRTDQYGNLVTSGSNNVYLYTNSADSAAKFYSTAFSASPINSAVILDGHPSVDFWYYAETASASIITASDNSSSPDGAAGIADATAAITITPAAVAQFTLNNPGNVTAGNRLGYTVTRKDSFGNAVTSGSSNVYLYSSSTGLSKSFYAASTGGSAITSVTISGSSTANFWYYDELAGTWTITASDNGSSPDGANGIFDATQTVVVSAAAVSKFTLSNPGNMNAGTRLGYTVTRKDQFDNLVTSGVNTVYLYSSSTGLSKSFYAASTGDSAITSINIGNTLSSADFWYYDTALGTWTITASDNSGAPDGAAGIDDATDSVAISTAAIVATKLVISAATTASAGAAISVQIKALDADNNLDTTFHQSVTLVASGSATGEGVVTLVNGIGIVNITDTAAETVQLTLLDTGLTGLDVSSVLSLTFTAPSSALPTFGAVAALPPALVINPAVSFSGRAFPGAQVTVVANVLPKQITKSVTSASDGSFEIDFPELTIDNEAGSYGLLATDKDGRLAQVRVFNLKPPSTFTVKNIFISPALSFIKPTVAPGEAATAIGYATPGSKVYATLDGANAGNVDVAADGTYYLVFDTAKLLLGTHRVRVQQVDINSIASDPSPLKTFIISKKKVSAFDLTGDSKVNIQDWSMFIYIWNSDNPVLRQKIDFNHDGKVDVQDFSAFLKAFKKL